MLIFSMAIGLLMILAVSIKSAECMNIRVVFLFSVWILSATAMILFPLYIQFMR